MVYVEEDNEIVTTTEEFIVPSTQKKFQLRFYFLKYRYLLLIVVLVFVGFYFYATSTKETPRADTKSENPSHGIGLKQITPIYIEPTPIPKLATEQDRVEALRVFNYYRQLAGIQPAMEDPELTKGAQLHTHYIFSNRTKAVDFHSEDPSNPFYTPEGAKSAGGMGSGGTTLAEAVKILFFTDVLHRFDMQNPTLKSVGFGFEGGIATIDTKNGVVSDSWDNWPVVFPAPNQIDIPLSEAGGLGIYKNKYKENCLDWQTKEKTSSPDVMGFGIMIQFDRFSNPAPTLTTASIIDSTKKHVPFIACVPNNGDYYNFIGLYPTEYYKPHTTYSISVLGTYRGNGVSETWSFITGN